MFTYSFDIHSEISSLSAVQQWLSYARLLPREAGALATQLLSYDIDEAAVVFIVPGEVIINILVWLSSQPFSVEWPRYSLPAFRLLVVLISSSFDWSWSGLVTPQSSFLPGRLLITLLFFGWFAHSLYLLSEMLLWQGTPFIGWASFPASILILLFILVILFSLDFCILSCFCQSHLVGRDDIWVGCHAHRIINHLLLSLSGNIKVFVILDCLITFLCECGVLHRRQDLIILSNALAWDRLLHVLDLSWNWCLLALLLLLNSFPLIDLIHRLLTHLNPFSPMLCHVHCLQIADHSTVSMSLEATTRILYLGTKTDLCGLIELLLLGRYRLLLLHGPLVILRRYLLRLAEMKLSLLPLDFIDTLFNGLNRLHDIFLAHLLAQVVALVVLG